MPTLVTRYVDTRSPAGGNGTTPSTGSGDANRAFNNFSASLAATSASFPDLVSADIILKIECAGGLDTGSLGVAYAIDYITDYDRYLWIAASSESKASGIWDNSKYVLSHAAGLSRLFNINNIRKVRFEGLQIENRSTNGVWAIMTSTTSTPNDKEVQVIDCHLRSISGSGNAGAGISIGQVMRKNVVVVNTIIEGAFSPAIQCSFAQSGSQPTVIHNNTIFGGIGTGIALGSVATPTTNSIYNNIVIMSGSGTTAFSTSSGIPLFTGGNISSDNTSPQIDLRNIIVQFVNTASGDFRLIDRLSPAVNTGTNLTTDILYPFATDIAGNIRGTGRGGRAWDIGAVEYQRPSTIVDSTTSPLVFSDNFNRANGPLGSNWVSSSVIVSNLQISSNTINVSTGGGYSYVNPAVATFPPDQEAELTLTARFTFDYIGAGVRMGIDGTGYALAIDGRQTSYSGVVLCNGNGTFTQIASGLWTVAEAGDTYRIRIIGNRITVFRNNIPVTSFTDTTYTTGQPGIIYIADNIRGTFGDNFIARSMRNSAIWSTTGTRGRVISSNTWG